MGSFTYGDRRWQGFGAACLVAVIEHIDPPWPFALELSLFADAKPDLVIVTTANLGYNALFEGLEDGTLRYPDHRFEPLGPLDDSHGAPSQMAVFSAENAA